MAGLSPAEARAAADEALMDGRGSDNGPSRPEDVFPLLKDLMDDPELLRPPPEVLGRLAWRGRTTGVIGPDKCGKSTLAAHGVAALTTGAKWLDSRPGVGSAVVAAPDEAVGDTVRRLQEVGANPERVRILTLRPPDLLGNLDRILTAYPTDLVVVDSLAEWARLTLGRAPEDGDASGWGAVVRPLVQLSRDHECGMMLLHHPRRSDGQYRGSGEIVAALDCLLEIGMPQNGENPTLRRFRGRARWPVEDFSIRMTDEDTFQLGGGGEVSLEARVILDTRRNPGTTRYAQHKRLGGRKSTHVAAVNRLLGSGIEERDGGLYVAEDIEERFV